MKYIELRSNLSQDQQKSKINNYLIGIYGAPGTGKSTFINRLVRSFKVEESLKNLVPITITFNYLSSMEQGNYESYHKEFCARLLFRFFFP